MSLESLLALAEIATKSKNLCEGLTAFTKARDNGHLNNLSASSGPRESITSCPIQIVGTQTAGTLKKKFLSSQLLIGCREMRII